MSRAEDTSPNVSWYQPAGNSEGMSVLSPNQAEAAFKPSNSNLNVFKTFPGILGRRLAQEQRVFDLEKEPNPRSAENRQFLQPCGSQPLSESIHIQIEHRYFLKNQERIRLNSSEVLRCGIYWDKIGNLTLNQRKIRIWTGQQNPSCIKTTQQPHCHYQRHRTVPREKTLWKISSFVP